eukprot:CAMPEP_0206230676 /NCGR_PEP_ID=MMETSP0047_2-20121206/10398_1 /ASSEMBLY_ACC=CAM_ASM_000192 /TAXON_ID=195065 /ORGANISM="Chroomonas mesostigmatica_cf, Strain CCMP1168" /LENGTH=46 /DNA_ID= /DNA_START= /DNA_END= /DNA_ORIENTATION=
MSQLHDVYATEITPACLAAAAEAEHEVQSGFLLDVVVGERAAVLEL